jgi:hypothetical protein
VLVMNSRYFLSNIEIARPSEPTGHMALRVLRILPTG